MIKLKDILNKEFSAVALQPVRDLPEPPPVLGSPGMAFALGAGQAIAGGFAAGEFDGPGNALNDIGGDFNAFDVDTSNIFGSGPGQISLSSTFEMDSNWMDK